MPAAPGTKRVKGISIHRPFVFGSKAVPLPAEPAKRPPGISPDHTHQWTVYVRGVDGADITYWLRKVQFKLHETYAQPLRMIEAPAPFEVTETGWGEFEVGIKMTFVPESGEKPASVYHQLKLHPWGEDAEAAKERGDSVVSQNYEEVVFNEPSEAFYEILTTETPPAATTPRGGKGSGGAKSAKLKKGAAAAGPPRTAEIPEKESPQNPYSRRAEQNEVDRLNEAAKQVEALVKEEKLRLAEREKELEALRKSEGLAMKASNK